MYHWQRWFLRDRICISACCYPHHWAFHWRENGARLWHECLDTTLAIGPWSFNLTIWGITWLSLVIRWIPTKRNGHGFLIGW